MSAVQWEIVNVERVSVQALKPGNVILTATDRATVKLVTNQGCSKDGLMIRLVKHEPIYCAWDARVWRVI